jgi:hypothetical protein
MIPIPIGTKHTAAVEGSADKLVICEQCGQEYVYTVEEVAVGQGTDLGFMHDSAAKAVAVNEARDALKAQLHLAWRAVPCPRCGWYQAAMVQLLREGQYRWVGSLGYTCGVLCPLVIAAAFFTTLAGVGRGEAGLIAISSGLWVLGISLGAASPVLARLRSQWLARYTPNDEDVEARKLRGRRQALPREEYDKVMRELRKKHMI